MSIQSEFEQQLKSADPGSESQSLIVSELHGVLRVELLALDSIGCSFESIQFESDSLRTRTTEQLRQLADDLAKRVTYLLEPIRTIEVDAKQETVQMRSDKPNRSEEGKSYYEVVAQPGVLLLCRFLKPAGEPRRRIPAMVTRETIMRLVGDLVQAAA